MDEKLFEFNINQIKTEKSALFKKKSSLPTIEQPTLARATLDYSHCRLRSGVSQWTREDVRRVMFMGSVPWKVRRGAWARKWSDRDPRHRVQVMYS